MHDECSLGELEARADEWDDVVARAPDVDRICSSLAWGVSWWQAFAPERRVRARIGEHGALAFARVEGRRGERVLLPLEAGWTFACPVPATEPDRHWADVTRWLADDESWDAVLIAGLRSGSRSWRALVSELSERFAILSQASCQRCVADLSEGREAWLARRSRGMRRTLRRARERVSAEGIESELVRDATPEGALALEARLQSVESRSWKGLAGVGAQSGPMRRFYREMMPRLARRGWLRLLFLRHEDEDVAYVLGASWQGRFRGLQFSYDAQWRSLGLGNVAQLLLMEALSGELMTWDLGQDVPYKRRWADRVEPTSALFALRR